MAAIKRFSSHDDIAIYALVKSVYFKVSSFCLSFFFFSFFLQSQAQSDGYLAKFEQLFILASLHNINRQNVRANKFILGRLGENQP